MRWKEVRTLRRLRAIGSLTRLRICKLRATRCNRNFWVYREEYKKWREMLVYMMKSDY
jgi:hypothetical protein